MEFVLPERRVQSAKVGSFRGGGDFLHAFFPRTAADFSLLTAAHLRGVPILPVGGCTNLLVPDGGYPGLSVHTDRLVGLWLQGEVLLAGSALRLPLLAIRAADAGLSGLEALSGIPGTLGGAIVMNAGAYGASIAPLLMHVTCFDHAAGRFVRVDADAIPFGYRTSGGFFRRRTIVAAALRLQRGDPGEIRAHMDAFRARRAATQPHAPSLGSVWRRVGDRSAGYLAERAGLKGLRVGGATISEVHAGFVVNLGEASASDFLALTRLAEDVMEARYALRPVREFVLAGEEDEI